MERRLHIVWLVASTIILSACTREMKNDSHVLLKIPTGAEKVAALSIPSGYNLEHIVVNVRAPGLPPILWSWDKKCGSNCERTPPVDIVMDVPSGPSRLIQYLGVYHSSSDGNMLVYYGDTQRDLVIGRNDVTIVAQQYGTASGQEGNIVGQYVASVENVGGITVGRGPTDIIDIMFRPSNGAQPMLIETKEMFNGWLAVFGLAGIPLEYVRRSNKETLVHNGASLTMDSMISATSGAMSNLVRVQSPAVFWVDDGGSSRRESSGGVNVMGFMGPAVSSLGAKACYPTTFAFTTFWKNSVSGPNLTYCSGGCSTEDVQRMGSSGAAVASCNMSSNGLISEIEYDPNEMRNGKWGLAPFLGPFKKAYYTHSPGVGFNCYTGNKYADGCYDHTNQVINFQWNYIPHVFTGPNAISGVALMAKVYQDSCDEGESCLDEFQIQNGDLFACPNLEARGFTKVKDFLPGDAPTHALAISGGLPLGGNMIALLCPYRDSSGGREYFRTGVLVRDLKAPPLVLANARLESSISGDNTTDGFLVDASLASSNLYAKSDTVAGAVSYEAIVNYSGTDVCTGPNATPNFILPTCIGTLLGYSDGSQFKFVMRARDVNGHILREFNQNFNTVSVPPNAGVSISGCVAAGGFLNVNLVFSAGPTGVSSFDWTLNYGSINSNTNVTFVGAGTYFLNSTMIDTGTYMNTLLTIKLNHVSGYPVFLSPLSFNAVSGTCF